MSRENWRVLIAVVAAIALSLLALQASTLVRAASSNAYKLGDRLPAPDTRTPSRPADSAGFRTVEWKDLLPKDWDPAKLFDTSRFSLFGDGDPRAIAALEELRRAWDNAPGEPSLDQARIRIPGFVVPLDFKGGALKEFLLVPYFGACIHVPPPPSNQVIHVTMDNAAKDIRSMDAVWVSGQVRVAPSATTYGKATYRMTGDAVIPYKRGT
jgi:hypothetical protein